MSYVGQLSTFSTTFTDASGDGDPDVVTFWLREEIDGTELQWSYNAAPVEGTHYPTGMNPIVRDSEGNYHVDFVPRKPERHTGAWVGSGTIFQAPSPSVLLVRHSPIDALEP